MTTTEPLDDRILQGMLRVVGYMENYRAFYEARGFSRDNAEAMTVRYHSIICAEVERDLVRSMAT